MEHRIPVLHAAGKIAALLILSASLSTAEDRFQSFEWLVGDWIGEGSGTPGQGSGAFSFRPDLQGLVLVRKSYAEYPATGGKPASRHDDLMIIYRDKDRGDQYRADFYDSEGHVIRYHVDPSVPGRVEFTSDVVAGSPSYRLIYTKDSTSTLKLTFAIAPPNSPTIFKTYIEAKATRKPQ